MAKEQVQIGNREIIPGSHFTTEAKSPIGEPKLVGGTVESIKGGGFYGKVMVFEDEVIKTTEPDSWHKLWRHINWGLSPFPSQGSEDAAQLDFLSGKIISTIVPALTDNRVITPDSIGYADLGEIGFGQVIERMEGRGARFDLGVSENAIFAETRKSIWNLGVMAGLESAAQVHPDNPFGKPNIWTTAEGQMIWLDLLPAIKHTGRVWPLFNFKFHSDVREKIGGGQLTFNRIHTDKLRSHLTDNSHKLTGSQKQDLDNWLTVYDEITSQQQSSSISQRQLVINDALKRKIISPDAAQKVMNSDLAYASFLAGTIIKPGLGAIGETLSGSPVYRIFTDKQFQADSVRFFKDPMFRKHKFTEATTLRGARKAWELGLMSDQEWQEAWDVLSSPPLPRKQARKLAATYFGLQLWYATSSSIMNAMTFGVGGSAFFSENPLSRIALAGFIEFVLPSIVRVSSTTFVSLLTRQELSMAIKASALPYVGGYIAVAADLSRKYGDRSKNIWHYTKRSIVASLSKILKPWGGWNSDREERLWDKLKMDNF